MLTIRSQHFDESIEEYFQELSEIAKNCNFQAVIGDENCNEVITNSFISSLAYGFIRQRLRENQTIDLKMA